MRVKRESNHENFFLIRLAVIPLILPTTSLTAYFGGIIRIIWI